MTDRDLEILRLVARYGLVTVPVLAAMFFQGLTGKAVERVVTHLLQEGWLRSQPLLGRQHGYTLTAQGARLLGLDEKRFARTLGIVALIKCYAVLQFCVGGPVQHRKMTAAEFRERFPALCARGMSHDRYYLDDQARLSLLVGDFGADWARLARRVRREAQRRRALDAWKPFFASRLFSVTVLVASEEKERALRVALQKEAYPVNVGFSLRFCSSQRRIHSFSSRRR